MPEVILTTVYKLDELSCSAKETARAWFRQTGLDYDWYDSVYEDFATICTIFGIRIKTTPVRHCGRVSRSAPNIFFSGFWCQGDGASFEGSYAYEKSTSREIRNYAPQDIELHRIADALHAIQRRNMYQLRAETRHHGHYYHEYCMAITVERDSPIFQAMTTDAEDDVMHALRDLARWLYRQLEKEYEYLSSDAAVDEAILANSYTFTETGSRFG